MWRTGGSSFEYGQVLQEGTLEHRKELLRGITIDPNAARGTITYYELPAESLMIVPGARWTIFPPSRVSWHFKFLISLEGIV